jgi:hypothetical protein
VGWHAIDGVSTWNVPDWLEAFTAEAPLIHSRRDLPLLLAQRDDLCNRARIHVTLDADKANPGMTKSITISQGR